MEAVPRSEQNVEAPTYHSLFLTTMWVSIDERIADLWQGNFFASLGRNITPGSSKVGGK